MTPFKFDERSICHIHSFSGSSWWDCLGVNETPEGRKIVYPNSFPRSRSTRLTDSHTEATPITQYVYRKFNCPKHKLSMRAIRKSSSHQACTPNILPCRIQHNGHVDASRRFWSPVTGGPFSLLSYYSCGL
jgi:hypothetical protein